MNDLIRELMEQAGITTNLDTDYFDKDMNKWVDYFSEKFAELIVRECSETVQDFVDHRFPASEYPERLKKYFGVE